MKRLLLLLLATSGVSSSFAARAAAQDLSQAWVERHYRFLPRVSRLVEIDPVSDPPIPWIVLGDFDFLAYPPHPAAFLPAPHFANVDAWASHPMLAISVGLDDVVNLTGMMGRALNASWPHPPRVEVFQFKGEDGNGYPADVFVARAGRWIYMRGENHPTSAPTEQGPFRSKWILKGIARQTPFPDFDRSEIVDGDDLLKWAEGFGDALNPVLARDRGDADADGDIDGGDFLTWQQNLGDAPPSFEFFDAEIEAAVAGAASAVPEPSTGVLLAVGLAALRRRSGVRSQESRWKLV
jgi:hypothetical protein